MLIVAYAATYMAMRYFFPPEMKRWSLTLTCWMPPGALMEVFSAHDQIPDLRQTFVRMFRGRHRDRVRRGEALDRVSLKLAGRTAGGLRNRSPAWP
jgi:hypothetical protein